MALGFNNKATLATVLAFIFNAPIAFSGFFERTYDSWTHMFFANHYLQSWFELWNTSWYTGFSVASYPPLAHQMIALLAIPLGLTNAYSVLTLALATLFPFTIYRFSTIFVSEDVAGYAAILAVFLPSAIFLTYVFGTLPSIFALILSLAMAVEANHFMKKRSTINFVAALAFAGASVMAHHTTGLILTPLLLTVVMLSQLSAKPHLPYTSIIIRYLTLAGSSILLYLAILMPFWRYIFEVLVSPQTPVPHPSRFSLLDPNNLQLIIQREWFFWNMYTYLLILIPITTLAVVDASHRRLYVLGGLSIFLFTLGLGGTTPLPELVFGSVASWLTYERFALWAGAVSLPLFAVGLRRIYRFGYKRLPIGKFFAMIFIIIMFASSAQIANTTLSKMILPSNLRMDEVIEFLDKDEHWRWRYITLGFGENQLSKLSTMTNASTVDGMYNTGRELKVLRESGVAALDGSKHIDPDIVTLKHFLANADDYGLKWVFSMDRFYEPVLAENNFTMLYVLSNNVAVFANEGIQMADISNHPQPILDSYIWGLAPVSTLAIALLLTAWRSREDVWRQGKKIIY